MAEQTEEQQQSEEVSGQCLTQLDFEAIEYVPGKYAPWPCSDQPVFGPDEMGEYLTSGIEKMMEAVNKADMAARIWEILQAWEMRLVRRGYHFLNAGRQGWNMYGGGGANTSGAAILQTANSMKLFACNVFGQRHKKITALLSREVPGTLITAEDEDDPMDQAAAEEGEKFLEVFTHQANLKKVVQKIAGLFCTDGRVMTVLYTMADQTRWGKEVGNREQAVYGMPESDGITPETALQPATPETEEPARREVVLVGGKLESRVPLMADEEDEMGWAQFNHEVSRNMLRAKYPWIKDKIMTGGNGNSTQQIDRLARVNVRLAVQASSTSGEAHKNDSTESVTFFRPSEYESIDDEAVREVFYENFPDGLEVWYAGGQFAFCRNGVLSEHVKVVHPSPGDGQNRESLLSNYLPLQKILNANISLIDRYFRAAIPRRYALEPYIDTQLMNAQTNDPGKVTPVTGLEDKNLRIQDITGVESVPTPNDALFQFVQWLIQGGPEAMDGGSPAAFGDADNGSDTGVFKTTRLRRDQALQVFSMPWGALCEAVCAFSQQAVESGAKNRIADISASLPGQKKLKIELSKLKGSVLVQPASLEIPQTLAEQEEQMAELLQQSQNVALFQQIMLDPRNLSVFAQFPSMRKLNIPGADQVEEQQGEFEILMRSGPVDNPQLQTITEQIQKAEGDPEAQTPQGMQVLQQLQQIAQTLPPMVSTVPVAQNTSENHMIHAAITLGMLSSPTGRKLKYGDDEQKAIYQNLFLHWQEHMNALKALQQPPQVEMKASVAIDPSKLPPAAQAKAFQALGLQVSPSELTPDMQEHELTEEREGVDQNGVPVKQKISVAGKPLS